MAHIALTIGRLARRHGISRGTLLHYDAIGLLRPSGRTAAGYRVYDADDVARLGRIRAYRAAGLSLERIKTLLDETTAHEDVGTFGLLASHLVETAERMAALDAQFQATLALIGAVGEGIEMTRAGWTAALARAGLDEDASWRWHAAFEAANPQRHATFLTALGLSDAEAAEVRRRATTLNV